MLRLLARTVGHLWDTQPSDATAIHVHHIDPGFGPIHQEFVTRLNLQIYNPAIRHHGLGDTEIEVWRMPSPATPQLTTPTRLAGLRGEALELVEHRVFKQMQRAGLRISSLRPVPARRQAERQVQGYNIPEELALTLGLLFRVLAPMRSRPRMRQDAEGEEGELGQLLVETVILHAARTQTETGKALKDAAQHYKVDTDAIAQKVKAEFAAKEKAQAAKKTAAKAQPKPAARPTAAKKAKAA
jgi:hypothetical protein